MPLPRKKTFVVFREAAKVGPYDERPMLPADTQLQICLSRNDREQPFFLTCEKDTMIVAFSGAGSVLIRHPGAHGFPLEPGDHVYVPGGAPTRISPRSECVILRYKPRDAGLEAVSWYCEPCGAELYRHVFDTAITHPQEGYLAGCRAFNGDDDLRRCEACGWTHAAVDLEPYRWETLARSLRE
jgi:hypothetical protein